MRICKVLFFPAVKGHSQALGALKIRVESDHMGHRIHDLIDPTAPL
jgi:hypothetical protein